jgi:hypothetical protein
MVTADNGFSSRPRSDGSSCSHARCCSQLKTFGLGLAAFLGLFLTARATRADQAATPADATATAPADATATAPADATATAPANATATAPATAPADATATTDAEVPSEVYLPGSPKPYGLGLSPEAPFAGPAPGGRAPSFGTPTENDEWTFHFGARIAAFEAVGVGRKPEDPPPGYKGTPLHVPALIQGRQPFWPGAGMSLFLAYGNSTVQATVSYYASMAGQELRGYWSPYLGPTASQAYITYTPPAFGATRLQAKVGAFTEVYGGVGEWGWGIFGPLLGVRGYGEVLSVEHEAGPNTTLWFSHGMTAVPAIPESLPRGDYVPWVEQGMSSFVQHIHAGINYKSNYKLRLHFAQINGTDEQTYMSANDSMQKRDGRIRVLALESHTLLNPWGHIGVAASYYDLKRALSVNDGLWWGIDWTQGGREQVNKFLGTGNSGDGGTGKVLALSAQWDFSAARIMWYPRNFDGRSPDIKAHIAGIKYFTLDAEPATLRGPLGNIQSVDTHNSYKGKGGYLVGTEVQYSVLPWLAFWLRAYGENRYAPPNRNLLVMDVFGLRSIQDSRYVTSSESLGPFWVYSVTPSVQFRSDWSALDGIEIAYSRRFYSKAVDSNPNQPLDRNVVTIGAFSSF